MVSVPARTRESHLVRTVARDRNCLIVCMIITVVYHNTVYHIPGLFIAVYQFADVNALIILIVVYYIPDCYINSCLPIADVNASVTLIVVYRNLHVIDM